MFSRFTLLLPSATSSWEVWSCPSAAAGVLLERTPGLAVPDTLSGRVIGALPARICRTLALRIPSQDPRMVRPLAFAQLEKRGLAAVSAGETTFECYTLPLAGGGAVLSVDVVAPEASAALAALKPAGLLAAARCYELPDGPLVLVEEQGHLVLWAGHRGTLIHSHILSADRACPEAVAAEIRITALTLIQQGLLPEITGVEMHGEFPPAEAGLLGTALSLPVSVKPRPVPDPARIAALSSVRLLPAKGRAVERGRRLQSLKWVAAAVLAGIVGLWGLARQRALAALEKQAARLEETVQAASGTNLQEKAVRAQLHATQERWQGLRMALEPRRYPMIHLNSLTRCLGEANIVLGRFESKGPDLAVSGTANSAMEAYTYYRTVTSDPELRIYELSMVQPVIAPNGTAQFQIKGKMK